MTAFGIPSLFTHFNFPEVMDIFLFAEIRGFLLCSQSMHIRLTVESKLLLDESD